MKRCDDGCCGQIIIKDEVDSTNNYLSCLCDKENIDEYTTIVSTFQTRGKGQIGNSWESERGMNLTFSTVIFPNSILAHDQFIISMITSTAICDTLMEYTDDISIKWPNDIYWKDKKICGMLIENDLQGVHVARSILGIGLNINQRKFYSNAPNPVSLYQIIGCETELNVVLNGILRRLKDGFDKIKSGNYEFRDLVYSRYRRYLYRRDGLFLFNDEGGDFTASIYDVEFDGHLILQDTQQRLRSYIFKEVRFII